MLYTVVHIVDKLVIIKFKLAFTKLKSSLPDNIHLLHYYVPNNKPILHIRLHHIFEREDKTELSNPVTIDLSTIFNDFTIKVFAKQML